MKFPRPSPPKKPGRFDSLFWIKVPAISAAAFCLALGVFFLKWDSRAMSLRYQAIAQKALDEKDYPTAFVAGNRLLSLGGESRNDGLFTMALADLGTGRTGEASDILRMVAPPDRAVFAPAHLFVARTLMARSSPSERIEAAALAQIHHALELDPNSREAKELLARCHRKKENP